LRRTLLFLAITLGCTSCSNTPKGFYPVHGKVVCKGEPVEGADVTFHRKNSDGSKDPNEVIPAGVCDETGTFTLHTPAGEGAPPGEYYVFVRMLDVNDPKQKRNKGHRIKAYPEDMLKGRYTDHKKPVFFATVTEGDNELPPLEIALP
jgi:hypothetical protein